MCPLLHSQELAISVFFLAPGQVSVCVCVCVRVHVCVCVSVSVCACVPLVQPMYLNLCHYGASLGVPMPASLWLGGFGVGGQGPNP